MKIKWTYERFAHITLIAMFSDYELSDNYKLLVMIINNIKNILHYI